MPPIICGSTSELPPRLRLFYSAVFLTTRSFSSSPSQSKVAPESPRFIELPRPPQRYAISHRDIKGTLPVPRNLFPKRAGDKACPEYLAKVTPEPTADRKLAEPPNEHAAWKRRMAASRRQNLRDGLTELHQRKVRTDNAIALRSAVKQANRARSVNAPPREDERLTAPTVTSTTRTLLTGTLLDPNREARLAAAGERVESRETERAEKRREALHTLYMHAREFITTEAHLEEKIESVFSEEALNHAVGSTHESNIWEVAGPPTSIQTMLSEVNNTQKTAVSFYKSPAVNTSKRMKQIAEELTGGKMD